MALHKLPDIDMDFPHDRKDDVIDLIFRKYGEKYCAVVGGFSTYKSRGAMGDVAKVLGVSEYQIRRVTERFPYAGARDMSTFVAKNHDFLQRTCSCLWHLRMETVQSHAEFDIPTLLTPWQHPPSLRGICKWKNLPPLHNTFPRIYEISGLSHRLSDHAENPYRCPVTCARPCDPYS